MNKSNFKAKKLLAIAFSTALLISSCKKDSTSSSSTNVTDDETAEAITNATINGGLTTQTSMMAVMVVPSKATIACGSSKDTSIVTSGTRSNVNYSYSLALTRTISFTNYIPSTLTVVYNGINSYTASKMSSSDSAIGSLVITQLQPTYSSYIFNGMYERKGTQQSSVNVQRTITSDIKFTVASLVIDKTTDSILSGIATISFSGSTSGSASTTRGATLTFNGNNMATLVLDNGNSYSFSY